MWNIRDWMGHIMFDGRTFETFEDGWEFIRENVPDDDHAWDDLFVDRVNDPQ